MPICPSCKRRDVYEIVRRDGISLYGCNCGRAFSIEGGQ